jgi:hypothetical protein
VWWGDVHAISYGPDSPGLRRAARRCPVISSKRTGSLAKLTVVRRVSSRYGRSLAPRASYPRLPAKQIYRDMARSYD